MTQTPDADALVGALRAAEAKARDDAATIARQSHEIDRLQTFLADIGIDGASVLDGYWIHNAAKLIKVSIDEERHPMTDVAEQERSQIMAAARRLVPSSASDPVQA